MDYFNNYAQCIYYTKFYKHYKKQYNIVREYMEYNLFERKYSYEYKYNKFINYYFGTNLNIKKDFIISGEDICIKTIYIFNEKTIERIESADDVYYIYDNIYFPSLTILTMENNDEEHIVHLYNVDVCNAELGKKYYFHFRK